MIKHLWRGNTFFIDEEGQVHVAWKGLMKFFDFRIIYLDDNAKKTKNDKSKTQWEIDGEMDSLFGGALEEFKNGN